jgi:tetratricopeptide (TPR) repeat protein
MVAATMKLRSGLNRSLTGLLCAVAPLAFERSALGADTQVSGSSQFESLVQKGEAADAQFDPNTALQYYLQAYRERPKDPKMLLKIAKEYSDSTLAITDPEESRRRIEKALEFSDRAIELDPHSAVALLSKAICYGKLGMYSDTREKIANARLVKKYTDQALAEDPNYAYAHHVLGQWEYEVATLGRTKRFLVCLIFGELPEASTQEGVHQLELAVQLEPSVSSHRLALGYAYLANGEPAKARQAFERVVGMPCRELYDKDCRMQAERAIAGM